MHDDAILLHAALYVWNAPVCAMMDDERDSYMQHGLAASELHKPASSGEGASTRPTPATSSS